MKKQNGSVTVWAIVIAIVIIAVAGYWYLKQNSMASQSAKTLSSPSVSSEMKTYTSSAYEFSIQYPISAQVTAADPVNGFSKGPGIFDATIQGSSDNAGSISGQFQIIVSDNSSASECLSVPVSSEAQISNVRNVTVNGISYLSYKVDDAFAGGSSTGYHYKTLSPYVNTECFDVYYYAQYTGGAAGSTLDISGEEAKINAAFQSILQTLKFI